MDESKKTLEGTELSEEELSQLSGGGRDTKFVCRNCGGEVRWTGPRDRYVCKKCGRKGMYPKDFDEVPI